MIASQCADKCEEIYSIQIQIHSLQYTEKCEDILLVHQSLSTCIAVHFNSTSSSSAHNHIGEFIFDQDLKIFTFNLYYFSLLWVSGMLWLVQKCANNAALCYYYALTLTHHHTNDTKGGATTAKCKLPLFLTCRRIMFGRPFIISGQVGGCRAGLLCFCIFPSGQSAPMCPENHTLTGADIVFMMGTS